MEKKIDARKNEVSTSALFSTDYWYHLAQIFTPQGPRLTTGDITFFHVTRSLVQ